LTLIGCIRKSYQENKREVWKLDAVEIMIDEWPFLEPLVEIEGVSEENVKKVSEALGFDYKNACFCSVSSLYNKKHKLKEKININNIPEFTFSIENPFTKYKQHEQKTNV
jgi:adenylate cyclase class 2